MSLLLTLGSSQALSAAGSGLAPGALIVGVHGVHHTLDALRYGDVRPTVHSDYGGRVEVAYAILPSFELMVSGYRGASHFDFDTGFEKGHYRERDWSMDIGPNILIGTAGPTRILIGGSLVYGEAHSRLSIDSPFGAVSFDGPRTFMVGGAGRLVATRPLLWRLEASLQLSAGIMQARGRTSPSGNLYEWNGSSVGFALGVRTILLRGRQTSE